MQHFSSIYLMVIVAVTLSSIAEAKRGCAVYGHSCYGGHGKRSDNTLNQDDAIPAEKFFQPESKEILLPINSNPVDYNQRDYQNQLRANIKNDYNYSLYNLLKQWYEDYKKKSENLLAQETVYRNNYV